MLTSAMAHAFDLMKAVKPNMNTIQSQLQSQNNMIDCIRRGQGSYEDDDWQADWPNINHPQKVNDKWDLFFELMKLQTEAVRIWIMPINEPYTQHLIPV